jgi:hypothetical protein
MCDPNSQDPPEPVRECESCGTKIKNGRCSYCDVEWNSDERVE